jgi:hypothetical protein
MWPEVAIAFCQVDLILHAGDIVTHVLEALANNDL